MNCDDFRKSLSLIKYTWKLFKRWHGQTELIPSEQKDFRVHEKFFVNYNLWLNLGLNPPPLFTVSLKNQIKVTLVCKQLWGVKHKIPFLCWALAKRLTSCWSLRRISSHLDLAKVKPCRVHWTSRIRTKNLLFSKETFSQTIVPATLINLI